MFAVAVSVTNIALIGSVLTWFMNEMSVPNTWVDRWVLLILWLSVPGCWTAWYAGIA